VLSARWLGELVASLGRKLEPQLLGNDAETVGTKRGESDLFFYGKALFDAREYLRAASILEACTSKLGRFLRWYSLFLHGEKRKEEMLLEVSPAGCAAPRWRPLSSRRWIKLCSPMRAFPLIFAGYAGLR
jgi:hypothetical protein